MGLKTTEGSYCGNRARLTADSEEGLVLSGSQQDCPVYNPRMDLGFASIQLEEVQLQEVSYDPAAGEWDFQGMMDATLDVEAFGSWSSLMKIGRASCRETDRSEERGEEEVEKDRTAGES